MAERTDLVVPELGESITEAVIGRWLKSVGDTVEADEPVVDLETDKITVQLPAPASGVLAEQGFEEGATVRVGDVVGQIDAGDGAQARGDRDQEPEEETAAEEEAEEAEEAEEIDEEEEAEDEDEEPEADEEIAATDGRPMTPAQRRAARQRQEAEAGEPPKKDKKKKKKDKQDKKDKKKKKKDKADARPAPKPKAEARPEPKAAPKDEEAREDVVPMSPLRKRIAERLVQAQHESASLTTFNEVDMSAVMQLRSQYKEEFEDRHGLKLGFMSFFVKACVAAAQKFPGLNAELRDDAIVYKKHYDFGIAVSTERGLVVPVLRDCDRLGFAAIEQGIIDLATKARDGKLTLDDLMGGTFSITNGGIYGSMMSTPLLNYPQTGILGMHNIVRRAVVVDDRVEVRPMMYLALTYDHRVVDGREAVQYLVAVKERIERPDRLMFEL
jgi:2-oxoglutarate dehydrogenase E2 component (dihydrolipoamide succinyltransferase)